MHYLKTFQIPSDGWVNWYFTPWDTNISPLPVDMPDPDNFIHPNKASEEMVPGKAPCLM